MSKRTTVGPNDKWWLVFWTGFFFFFLEFESVEWIGVGVERSCWMEASIFWVEVFRGGGREVQIVR